MRISSSRRPSGNRPLLILIALSAVFLFLFWQMIHKMPGFSALATLQGGIRNEASANRFDDAQREAINRAFAGYWVYEGDTLSAENRIHKKDRVEYLDNGIIWQLATWDVTMPSGTVRRFNHIRTAFCKPFGLSETGDTIAEVFILKQAFFTDGDTCVDNEAIAETWDMAREGTSVNLYNRSYIPYTGKVREFFPTGVIFLVDSIMRRDCNGRRMISEYVRTAVAAEFAAVASKGDRTREIRSVLDRYYIPAVINENWRGFSKRIEKKLGIEFEVGDSGEIIDVALTAKKKDNKMYFQGLSYEMKLWRFPVAGKGQGNTTVKQVFDLNGP
ncbi:MAG: hypothetical protein JXA71_07260 [Chitinispirillaceae bacterium]|nr:hypothetical protein [Chitinispirillaceae bacterium]